MKLVNTVLLDGNVYDKLQADVKTRGALQKLVARGLIKIIATPMVHDELKRSPFGGFPDWFPVVLEAENVTVLGYAILGMTRLGEGEVYSEHRGESKKIPDAIIADSADGLADILVSEDRRCRERLKRISARCRGMDYREFSEWLQTSFAERE
jgi:hypothetical protein